MRPLLDTHAFIWAAGFSARLSKAATNAIGDTANEVYLSAAAAWEISIKYDAGKIDLPQTPEIYLPSRIEALGLKLLSISIQHALTVRTLGDHHRDPFDRIMVAQAQVESLIFVTGDRRIAAHYAVQTLW